MITFNRASRWYGQVIGVNDVTCTFSPGVTALLGPNGAGKSTLIKLMTGQLRPTTGRVQVFGLSPFANPRVLGRIGYCPEIENCYEDLTGREFVDLLGMMSGLSGSVLASAAEKSIEEVGMTAAADRRIGGYSKGMRQRIKLAQALVHEPDILVLDEPLNGLDPVGRRDVARIIARYAGADRAVVVSSHILYEVEQITRNIVLMHHGRIRAHGDIYHIRALIDAHPHRVRIATDTPRELACRLMSLEEVISTRLTSDEPQAVECETRMPDRFYDRLAGLCIDEGYTVHSFESPDNNLEAVFRYLVSG